MTTKWLLTSALILLAVSIWCSAAGAIGQAETQGPSRLNVPVGQAAKGASVGEPGSFGLGISEQASSGIGVPQFVRERLANRETGVAGKASQPSEQPSDEQEGDDVEATAEEAPNADHKPFFISNLLDSGLLTEDQVGTMRSAGMGWGGIRISGLLADRIAGNSEDEMSFDDALDGVLTSRDEGMGFGEIARMNDLKVGWVLTNAN